MIEYSRQPGNPEEIKKFVIECENGYISSVKKIAHEIYEHDEIQLLTLAGPTCSGKTTSSLIISNELTQLGETVMPVAIDDFYKEKKELMPDGKPDYESIRSIDLDYFKECLDNILNMRETMLPIFDFVTQKRSGYRKYVPNKFHIVILEGIQAVYPEITSLMPEDKSRSIYISVASDVNAYGNVFNGRDMRFARRLVRDFKYRNASPSRTMSLWSTVADNEDKNIIPNKDKAYYSINSLMLYEFNVIKPYLLNPDMYDMKNQKEKELFEFLNEKYKNIPEISSEYVPKDSVFREFIG